MGRMLTRHHVRNTPQASLLQAPLLLIRIVLKEQERTKSSKGGCEFTSHGSPVRAITVKSWGSEMVLSQKPMAKVMLVGSRGTLKGMPLPV